MSSSNETAMTLPQSEPPASQTTPETTTNTNSTTNNNSNTNTITTQEEIDHHNTATTTTNKEVETPHHGDNSAGPDAQPTTDKSEGQGTCSGIWGWLIPRKRETNGKPTTTKAEDNDNSGTYNKMTHSVRVQKLQEKLKQVKQELKALQDKRDSELQKLSDKLEVEQKKDDLNIASGTLDDINKEIMKFKHISAPDRLSKKLSPSAAHLQQSKASNGHSKEHELVNIHQNQSFRNSSFYNEIAEIFKGLDKREQFFLSCFTVFPENAVVNRRIFVYWGVGEEILDELEKNMPEEMVDKILEEFQEKGLIEPAIQKRKRQVKSYKMHPLVRSAVAVLSQEAVSQEDGSSKDGSPKTGYQKTGSQRGDAQKLSPTARNFFDYDSNGNVLPQRDWTSGLDSNEKMVVDDEVRRSKRLCLQKVNEQDQLLNRKTKGSPISETDLERLVTIFNVSEPFPDLELACLVKMKDSVKKQSQTALEMKEPRAVDWLSKMKGAQVICLGSWPGSTKSHIEVESIEFLEGLANSKNLRFLSLQGVSRINKLPESIGNHSNLMILDLKECHNLEVLSGEIAKLTKLVYLDLSDCYLLPAMPKGLSALSELRVFKGFVISNSQSRSSVGSLDDLKELTKLRKLTINSSSKDFPTDEDLCALQKLGEKVLRKLTIAWGADPNKGSKTRDSKNGKAAKQVDHQGKAPKLAEKLGRILGSKKLMRGVESQEEHKDPIENAPARQQEVTFKSVTMNNPPTPPILKLEKLDLQCFPNPAAKWLTPDSLPDLEKLYIRGGSLETLDKRKWSKVKILRLKYLREVKMTWLELGESFPKLEYLEKVKCPGITLCPCDEHGVWMNNI
ncbi:uncharacterized protein LOC115970216 [Quercus lobata]|uniref:Disease resistance R13L4/SHOC-2-like LRR domain-containing protein n=1 Tax=Quercus lobata TaxID=97700 RepID=A0A7N2N1J7_QUELO|nr:uncharacterized protein LOC115970216 [Quercus lobata]